MLLDVVIALVIAVGLVGVLVPLLPGTTLIGGAILMWAVVESSSTGWITLSLALAVLVLGTVVKYAVPGRRLQRAGVPGSTQLAGAILGVVGFFVVPIVGLPLGFVLGVYLAEVRRLGAARAWASTKDALAAVGLSIVLELVAGLLAAGTWVVGAVAA